MATIIYEVNLKVENEIKDQYMDWLKHHIVEILKIEGFITAECWSRKPEDEGQPYDDKHVYWTVQYKLKNRDAIDNYLKNYAAAMRQDGLDRFGTKFSASRRILSLEHTF